MIDRLRAEDTVSPSAKVRREARYHPHRMIKLRAFIDNARRRPFLGLLVVLLLVAALTLVALHPAIDALEVAATCLAVLALVISLRLVWRPQRVALRMRRITPLLPRPLSPLPESRSAETLAPVRL